MKIKISFGEMRESLEAAAPSFPKYVAPLLNLANRYARGTVPEVVGQMSELIQDFPGRTLEEWRTWYLERYPEAIRAATGRILEGLRKLRESMDKIDAPTIERWVEDLVIFKTFIGLRFQEVILQKVAEMQGTTYRLSDAKEEARGIDGFVGDKAVAIKPETYKTKAELTESIEGEIIFYRKTKEGLEIEVQE